MNNFAASALSGYEFSYSSEKMNRSRLSNLAVVLESATNAQMRTNRLGDDYVWPIRNSHPSQAAGTTLNPNLVLGSTRV